MLSASEVKALVEAPGTDLTRTCKVDGQEATLQDLKTLLEIEAELQRIQSTYFSNSVTMTKEHQNAMQSLVRQLTTSGMTLRMNDSEEKDAAAVELGYKSQLGAGQREPDARLGGAGGQGHLCLHPVQGAALRGFV